MPLFPAHGAETLSLIWQSNGRCAGAANLALRMSRNTQAPLLSSLQVCQQQQLACHDSALVLWRCASLASSSASDCSVRLERSSSKSCRPRQAHLSLLYVPGGYCFAFLPCVATPCCCFRPLLHALPHTRSIDGAAMWTSGMTSLAATPCLPTSALLVRHTSLLQHTSHAADWGSTATPQQ